jgi:hypothetical protein
MHSIEIVESSARLSFGRYCSKRAKILKDGMQTLTVRSGILNLKIC